MRLRRRRVAPLLSRVRGSSERIAQAELVIVDGVVVKHRYPLEGNVVIVKARAGVVYERMAS